MRDRHAGRAVSRALGFALVACLSPRAAAQVDVLTYHNDNARTGQNLRETILTPANVSTASFGKLFAQPVDGVMYAQPLFMSQLSIPGRGTHNVVFVATEHDSVYAFDADTNRGSDALPLWKTSLIPSGGTTVPSWQVYGGNLGPEVGITGTPVIDAASRTLYVVAKTKENGAYVQRLHALDVATGAEKFGGPVRIAAFVLGSGDGSVNGTLTFDAHYHLQRSGLLLSNGVVYVAFASHSDVIPYHGWLIGYDAATLKKVSVFNTGPNALTDPSGYPIGGGAIWMAGCGPAADENASIYFMTGNGEFDVNTGGVDYGDSMVRLEVNRGLIAADYFTPYDEQGLDDYDADLGSGGVLLLPDSVGTPSHPHLIVGAGKEGSIFLVDRDDMGQFSPASNKIVQYVPYVVGGVWGSPAYYQSAIYFGGTWDYLKMFQIGAANILTPAVTQSPTSFPYSGTTPSISANGDRDGIVWALENDSYTGGPAILHAYDASNLANELYNSATDPSDAAGALVVFNVPTVANGKVYVGSATELTVYGPLHR